MAEEVRQVEHYLALVPNKMGEGARILGALRDAGVNLIAFQGYPSGAGRARVEFIPENGAAFVAAAKQAKLKLSKKSTAFYILGDDRPGAVADVLAKLAAARINVGAVQAVCGGAGRYGAIVFLPPAAVRKAATALGVAQRVISSAIKFPETMKNSTIQFIVGRLRRHSDTRRSFQSCVHLWVFARNEMVW